MKILIIANSIVGTEPGVSGGDARFIELAKNWQNAGYEIHLMSSKGGKILCEKMGLNVILHNITNSDRTDRLEFFIRLFKILISSPKLLSEFDEGLLYSASEQIYDVYPGFILKLLRPTKYKFGVVIHWLPPLLFWMRKGSTLVNSFLFLISERLGLILANINADVLLPVSDDTANSITANHLNLKPMIPVYCGVNLDEIETYVKTVNGYAYDVVFMKRVQESKGIFDLLEVWKLLIQKKPAAKLLVIGEGIDSERVKKYVTDNRLDQNVTFAGAIYDFETKFKLLRSAKVFVLPSYEENWAIVIGEALAAGVPVVCYDLPVLQQIWGDSLSYAKLFDKNDLLLKINELLDHESLRKEKAEFGKKYIKKYSWREIADNEIKLITTYNVRHNRNSH